MLPSPNFGSSTISTNADKRVGKESTWFRPSSSAPKTVKISIRCDICRVSCSSQEEYDGHLEEHIPCSFADCSFEGNFKTVIDHQMKLHMSLSGSWSRFKNVRDGKETGSSPQVQLLYGYYEEIMEQDADKWRQERKKNYPRVLSKQILPSLPDVETRDIEMHASTAAERNSKPSCVLSDTDIINKSSKVSRENSPVEDGQLVEEDGTEVPLILPSQSKDKRNESVTQELCSKHQSKDTGNLSNTKLMKDSVDRQSKPNKRSKRDFTKRNKRDIGKRGGHSNNMDKKWLSDSVKQSRTFKRKPTLFEKVR